MVTVPHFLTVALAIGVSLGPPQSSAGAPLVDSTSPKPANHFTRPLKFPTASRSPLAQQHVGQGFALLYTGCPSKASSHFHIATEITPGCAAAFCGLALTHLATGDAGAAKDLIEHARSLQLSSSPFESAFLECFSPEPKRSPDALQRQFPDCPDALAIAILCRKQFGADPLDDTRRIALGKHLGELLAGSPDHVGLLSGRIQLWEKSHPKRAINSIVRLTRIAPTLPQIWSDAAQIFQDSGYADRAAVASERAARLHLETADSYLAASNHSLSVESRIAAARLHLQTARRRFQIPDQIDSFVSNLSSLIDSLSILNQTDAALAAAELLISSPRHPIWNHPGLPRSSCVIGRQKLAEILELTSAWDLALEHCDSTLLETGGSTQWQLPRLRVLGLSLLHHQRHEELAAVIERLRKNQEHVGASIRLAEERVTHHKNRLRRGLPVSSRTPKPDRATQNLRRLLDEIDRTIADLQPPPNKTASPSPRPPAHDSPFTIPDPIPFSLALKDSAPPTPKISLPNQSGTPVPVSPKPGRPLLLIYYLGAGCLHCVDQLIAFDAAADTYADHGIDILAVGTDSVEELRLAHQDGELQNIFQFPLLADPEGSAFRAFGAFDPIHQEVYHGTILISPDGQALWRDHGHEPFMDTRFLLREAKRLLRLHAEAKTRSIDPILTLPIGAWERPARKATP